jgi:hypothetical protein
MGTSFAESLRDLRQGGSAQAAAITRGASGPPPRAVSVVHGLDRLRCASLLKPLYCWAAAAHVADQGFWRHHAEPAVITSSNSDTRALWMAVGPRVILAELRRRCGVSWRPANGDPSRFGSVEVAAAEVADAYAALSQSALAGDPVAGRRGHRRRGHDRAALHRRTATRDLPREGGRRPAGGGRARTGRRTTAARPDDQSPRGDGSLTEAGRAPRQRAPGSAIRPDRRIRRPSCRGGRPPTRLR